MRDSVNNRLGASIRGYLTRRRGEFSKNASVVDNWRELLPKELQKACSLESISGGIMIVAVEPGPYMHELRVLSEDLVQQLRQMSPRSGVRGIKLVPRSAGRAEREQEQW